MRTLRRQRGYLVVDHLVGAVVGAAMTTAAFQTAESQRGEISLSKNQEFVLGSVPSVLETVYYSGHRDFRTILGRDASEARRALRDRGALPDLLTDGSIWDVGQVEKDRITLFYGCEGLPTPSHCLQLAMNVNEMGTPMMPVGSASVAYQGCPEVGPACRVTVSYTRPR